MEKIRLIGSGGDWPGDEQVAVQQTARDWSWVLVLELAAQQLIWCVSETDSKLQEFELARAIIAKVD